MVDPKNNITLNNIGANLLQLGKLNEGKRYLELAYEINQKYPNSFYGLALYYQMIQSYEESFDWATKGIRICDDNNPIKKYLQELLFDVSNTYLSKFDASHLVASFIDDLETRSGKKIKLQIDNDISTAAKIEFAENHNNKFHVVKYKTKYPAYNHLIMHELVHLKLVLEAREHSTDTNKLFVITQEHRKKFIVDHESVLKKLEQQGYKDDIISNYIGSLFTGINQQIYMAPIDLFIEEFLFETYPILRPLQLISLHTILLEGINAVTAKGKVLVPPDILGASTILNIVSALHFEHLFGLNYLPLFGSVATNINIRLAKKMFNEFLKKKNTKLPGEEYEIVTRWAKELGLNNYFTFIDETEHRNSDYLVDKLNEIKKDPLSQHQPIPNDSLKGPLNFNKEPAGQMAVAMYCLDALQFFQDKSSTEIRDVGFEIALLGTSGIDPSDSNKKLHIASIPNKTFTGLHLLAFMYVAWQSIDPSQDLHLDFENEYKMAKSMFSKNK